MYFTTTNAVPSAPIAKIVFKRYFQSGFGGVDEVNRDLVKDRAAGTMMGNEKKAMKGQR